MLFTDKMATAFAERAVIEDPLIYFRRTGRSTQLAFEILAKCYAHKGVEILIKDHHGTREADRYLGDQIGFMIRDLRFEGFHFRADKTGIWIKLQPVEQKI